MVKTPSKGTYIFSLLDFKTFFVCVDVPLCGWISSIGETFFGVVVCDDLTISLGNLFSGLGVARTLASYLPRMVLERFFKPFDPNHSLDMDFDGRSPCSLCRFINLILLSFF